MCDTGSRPAPPPGGDRVHLEAVVQVGEVETWYRRAGRGGHVLLLTRRGRDERDDLFGRLAEEHLVIEPATLPDAATWAEWLCGVVDGLGLSRPDLVVDAEWGEAARRFASADPERAGRVILVDGIDP